MNEPKKNPLTPERKLAIETEAAKSLLSDLAGEATGMEVDIIESETNLLEAIDRALAEMDECEVLADGLTEKIKQFTLRRKAMMDRAERIKAMIERTMLVIDQKTLKTATATLTIKSTPKRLVIDEESLIPSVYWKVGNPVLDRALLNAQGLGEHPVEIPGTHVDNGGVALQIRRA